MRLEPRNTEIAIFIPSLDGGGAERVMVTLANAIAARGFKVDIVLAIARGPHLKSVSPLVRVVDLQSSRVFRALLPLMRYFRQEQPKSMLVAITHASVLALVARAGVHARTRLVISERSTISADSSHATGTLSRLTYALARRLYARADAICSVSRAASQDLTSFAGLPRGSVETIYNPFDLVRIQELAAGLPEHPWLLDGQPPVVMAIGRLTSQKDYATLILAFKQLRRSREVRLLILGEGHLRASLEGMVSEHDLTNHVQFPGYIDSPFSWLARSSLFVLSSRWEGLPGVLIEALACGVPVVSTNCPSGPEEILEGGCWGRLVPVGDVIGLANAMAETLDTPRHLLPDGRQRAAKFGLDRAVDSYLEILGSPKYPAPCDVQHTTGDDAP